MNYSLDPLTHDDNKSMMDEVNELLFSTVRKLVMLNTLEIKALFISMNALESAWMATMDNGGYTKEHTELRRVIFNDMAALLQKRGVNLPTSLQLVRFWSKAETHSIVLDDGFVVSFIDLIQTAIAYPEQVYNIEDTVEKSIVINTINEYLLLN